MLNEKNDKINELNKVIKGQTGEIEVKLKEIDKWKEQTAIVGKCLEGTIGVIDAIISSDSDAELGYKLGLVGNIDTLGDQCEQAGEIIEEVNNVN